MKNIEIKVLPLSVTLLFESTSSNYNRLIEILVGEELFTNIPCAKSHNVEWHCQDRMSPPYCPYEDIYEEKWVQDDYTFTNFLRSHSYDARLTGPGTNGFVSLRIGDQLIFRMNVSADNNILHFSFDGDRKDDEIALIISNIKKLYGFRDYDAANSPTLSTTSFNLETRKLKDFYIVFSGRFPWVLEECIGSNMFKNVPLQCKATQNNVVKDFKESANIPFVDILEGTFKLMPYQYKQIYSVNTFERESVSVVKVVLSKNDEPIFELEARSSNDDFFNHLELCFHIKGEIPMKKYDTIKLLLSQTEDDIYNKFLSLLKRNYTKEHQPMFYSQELKVLPDFLEEVVFAKSKNTAQEIINMELIKEVKMMLKHTEESFEKLSKFFNFADETAFVTFFYSHTEMTAKEFRSNSQ